MNKSWYKKYLPKIRDVSSDIVAMSKELEDDSYINSLYVFGSYAENLDDPNYRVKDINLIAKCPVFSEDLLSINKSCLSTKTEYLEEEGFNLEAVFLSKKIVNAAKAYDGLFDFWALSNDKKLLHWGAMSPSIEETQEIKIEAEKKTNKNLGFNLKNNTASSNREQWYTTFKSYINENFENQPEGWYVSHENSKEIINSAIKLF